MKKLLLLVALVLPLSLMAQISTSTIKPKEQFFILSFSTSTFSSEKGKIKAEFGRDTALLKLFDKQIIYETGKVTAYNTVADAFNYVAALGWEFVASQSTDIKGQFDNSKYIFKRKIEY